MKFNYMINHDPCQIEIIATPEGFQAQIGEKRLAIKLLSESKDRIEFLIKDQKFSASWAIDGPRKRWVALNGKEWLVEKATSSQRGGKAEGLTGEKILFAPMPGQVRQVLVAEGDEVVSGQLLILLEAMKMEIRILAPADGKVSRLLVEVDQQVDKDDLLAEIE